MKIFRYLAFGLLIIEGVANLFPLIFRPLLDVPFGILTIGQLMGLMTIFVLVAIILFKEQRYEEKPKA